MRAAVPRSPLVDSVLHAVGVAQLVELLVVVQAVGGSSPLAHPPVKSRNGAVWARWGPGAPRRPAFPGRYSSGASSLDGGRVRRSALRSAVDRDPVEMEVVGHAAQVAVAAALDTL